MKNDTQLTNFITVDICGILLGRILGEEMNIGNFEQIRARIETKGICARDIYDNNRLTDAEIAPISAINVYNWVKQGLWTQKHFKRWFEVVSKCTK